MSSNSISQPAIHATSAVKQCIRCAAIKSLDGFHRDKNRRDGRDPRCKECVRAYQAANREKMDAKRREWLARNPGKQASYSKKWREAHLEQALAMAAEYRAANRAMLNERARVFRKANLARYATYQRNYLARKAGAKGAHTFDEVWQMAEDQNHLCAYCESPLFAEWHVDHMLPLSRGGTDSWDNLAITCPHCNTSKRDKTAEEFWAVIA